MCNYGLHFGDTGHGERLQKEVRGENKQPGRDVGGCSLIILSEKNKAECKITVAFDDAKEMVVSETHMFTQG